MRHCRRMRCSVKCNAAAVLDRGSVWVQVFAQAGAGAWDLHGVPGIPCGVLEQPHSAAAGAAVGAVRSSVVLPRAGRRAAPLSRRHVCGEHRHCMHAPTPQPTPAAHASSRCCGAPPLCLDMHACKEDACVHIPADGCSQRVEPSLKNEVGE